MKKVLVVIILLVVGLPFAMQLMPEPMTVDRVKQAFEQADFTVLDFEEIVPPQREAVEHWEFRVGNYNLTLLRYETEAKAIKQATYMQPDAGTVAIESMPIGQPREDQPPKRLMDAARRGKWVLMGMGTDRNLLRRLVSILNDA